MESEMTLWRDNNAPQWTTGQHGACSVVPDIMVAGYNAKHISLKGYFFSCLTIYCTFWKAIEHISSRVILLDRINLWDFNKRKMLVFILRGSLIASFFSPFLCYPWAICCPVTAVWMESIILTLLRTYDPWPNLINSCKMVANIVRLHQFSAMSNNITDKWTSSTFMFLESQVTVLEV